MFLGTSHGEDFLLPFSGKVYQDAMLSTGSEMIKEATIVTREKAW